jgi:hypothetical protein
MSKHDPNSRQVGGDHYSGEYQHWDFATDLRMRHLEGAATKYLARAGNKAGEPRDKDLEKALHYLEKLLHLLQERRIKPLAVMQSTGAAPVVARFIASSMRGAAFTPRIVAALVLLSNWATEDALVSAIAYVRAELGFVQGVQ